MGGTSMMVLLFRSPGELEAYREFSERAGKVWRNWAPLEYVEASVTTCRRASSPRFPGRSSSKPTRRWSLPDRLFSRAERDRINAAVAKDPRISGTDSKSVPLRRQAHASRGGFEMFVFPVTQEFENTGAKMSALKGAAASI